MSIKPLLQILHALVDAWVIALFARLLLQKATLNATNPLAHFLRFISDWAVRPLRRFIPAFRGWDSASLVAATVAVLLFQALVIVMLFQYTSAKQQFMLWLLYSVISLLVNAARVLLLALFLRSILLFSGSFSPLLWTLEAVCRPLVAPFKRWRIKQVDFSPVVPALILWQLIAFALPAIEANLTAYLIVGG